jgi:hypothetical protein
VFPVRYELGFYIPEDYILHSRRREILHSTALLHLTFANENFPAEKLNSL